MGHPEYSKKQIPFTFTLSPSPIISSPNMFGNYLSIVYGFGGFRLKESGIYFHPVLPKHWTGYRFIIHVEDSRIMVHIKKNECFFKLKSGSAKRIFVYKKEYLLQDTLCIERSMAYR